MSLAGRRSTQGDEYQLAIAVHWVVQLLVDSEIASVYIEAVSFPEQGVEIEVDDVVVEYVDGHRLHIQAKKNQPAHRHWQTTDAGFRDELVSARDELERWPRSSVKFYSRSPFGDVQRLAEESRSTLQDYAAFASLGSRDLVETLENLQALWERDALATYQLARRLEFGPCLDIPGWEQLNNSLLKPVVTQAPNALRVIHETVRHHASGRTASSQAITRDAVLEKLERAGCVAAVPGRTQETVDSFSRLSARSAEWPRTVRGTRIPRAEVGKIVDALDKGKRSILVVAKPGVGKTCVLLDLAEAIDRDGKWSRLIIRGDHFSTVKNESEARESGLPDELVGRVARLAESQKVVVILDSLDVLALCREHGSLSYFLSLIARLLLLPNVVVVAACRTFDVAHDPLLREKQWEERVVIELLDFDAVVAPLLVGWGIAVDRLTKPTRELLRVPQNLKLFAELLDASVASDLTSPHQLYEAYFQQVILGDSYLGRPALVALQQAAADMSKLRSQTLPRARLQCTSQILNRLISTGVLVNEGVTAVRFSHQSLFEALAVRGAIEVGLTLPAFIKSQPALPFVRPFVRSFLFQLRDQDPKVFARDIRQVVGDSQTPYHIRRLAAESIAEMRPTPHDEILLEWMLKKAPDLFRRLFWATQSLEWFDFWVERFLPKFTADESHRPLFLTFIEKCRTWMNQRPEQVSDLWCRAMTEKWGEEEGLAWLIAVALDKFTQWEAPAIPRLIDALIPHATSNDHFIGRTLSRFVSATGRGDDLLWQFIAGGVTEEKAKHFHLDGALRCSRDEFHSKTFLEDHMYASPGLLTRACEAVQSWGAGRRPGRFLDTSFMHECSWHRRHSQDDTHHVDATNMLFDAIEHALRRHCKSSTEWWRSHETRLRGSGNAVFRYFLLQAYSEDILGNLDAIVESLTDDALFKCGYFSDELRKLLADSYIHLRAEDQDRIQEFVLNLYADDIAKGEARLEHVEEHRFELLRSIPAFLRSPKAQAQVDRFWGLGLRGPPGPELRSWGGWVRSPLSASDLLSLSDANVMRLLLYYSEDRDRWSHREDGGLIGGRREIRGTLEGAASRSPLRFLQLIDSLEHADVHPGYIWSVFAGAAKHLQIRFGNLQDQNWKAEEPLPDGAKVAQTLLAAAEQRYLSVSSDGDRDVAELALACSYVLTDGVSADRLLIILYHLLRSPDPSEDRPLSEGKGEIDTNDLVGVAINSVRGRAAEAAVNLLSEMLDTATSEPELLRPAIRRIARDHTAAVRSMLLMRLAFITYKDSILGWTLLTDILNDRQSRLWSLAERVLYYGYRDNFNKVKPFLERMIEEGGMSVAKGWGRLIALSHLEGHLDLDALIASVERTGIDEAWAGVMQVFAANLRHAKAGPICSTGIDRLLGHPSLPVVAVAEMDDVFDLEKGRCAAAERLAAPYLDRVCLDGRGRELHTFLDWLGPYSRENVDRALDLCEMLAKRLDATTSQRLWHTEPLVDAVLAILREADESDDPAFIARAIAVQDALLSINVHGLSEMLEEAAAEH